MKRVVVAGGGYGGLRAVERLANVEGVELTLVDANGFHFMQTEVYGYIAGTKDLDEIAVDLKLWCSGFNKPVTFIQSPVFGLDPDKRVLKLQNIELSYDYLIIATGARTRFPDSIDGLREQSFGIKRLDRAFNFRHKFEEEIKRKLEGESERVSIAVVGAGLSGVEVAAEMGYMLKRYRNLLGEHSKEIEVVLFDACDTILPGMDVTIVASAERRLKELGVTVKTSALIKRVEKEFIYFEDGEMWGYSFMIFTGGIVGNSEFTPETFEKNGIGQIKVNSHLQIDGYEEIFAIGDVAEIHGTKGEILPPTAQVAERSAEYCALAIKKSLEGKRAEPFRGSFQGMFIALGGRFGAAELFGFRFSGVAAYIMKRIVTFIYFLGIDLRANTGYKVRSKQGKK